MVEHTRGGGGESYLIDDDVSPIPSSDVCFIVVISFVGVSNLGHGSSSSVLGLVVVLNVSKWRANGNGVDGVWSGGAESGPVIQHNSKLSVMSRSWTDVSVVFIRVCLLLSRTNHIYHCRDPASTGRG